MKKSAAQELLTIIVVVLAFVIADALGVGMPFAILILVLYFGYYLFHK